MNSGQKANRTGNRFELFVEQALQEKGYTEFWDHDDIAEPQMKDSIITCVVTIFAVFLGLLVVPITLGLLSQR